MKIGVLTGGGDCPGLNAVIRAVVRKGIFHYRDEFVGLLEGWRGLIEDKNTPLNLDSIAGILPRGGTILRTSRTNPSKRPDGVQRCLETIAAHKLDALVAIGGDDTLSVAQRLHEQGAKSSACRRPLITTWAAPTTPSDLTPPATSPARRSIVYIPLRKRTTASWS